MSAIAAAGQQIERNDVMSAGVGQSDGRHWLVSLKQKVLIVRLGIPVL